MYDTYIINDTHVRIGGSLKNRFVPNINASKWDDECWLNINFPDIVSKERERRRKGKTTIRLANNFHRFYKKSDVNFEHEIVFAKRPLLDVVTFKLKFPPGLSFYFQPPLTSEEIARGCVRPPKVVGSYAVYWKNRNNKYQAGKFCHIYRPELIDAGGRRCWCDLQIIPETNRMLVYMPKMWLNIARYPVLLDPTFGYTTIGGTGATWFATTRILASASGAPTSDGTVSKITVYMHTSGISRDFKVGLYTDSTGPSSLVATEQETTGINIASGDVAWTDFSYTASITNGTTYWNCVAGSADTRLYYDSGGNRYYDNHTYADAWPATYTIDSSGAFTYSLYATYTATGGLSIPVAMRYFRNRRIV